MNTIRNLLTNLRTLLCYVRETLGYVLIFLWAIFCSKAEQDAYEKVYKPGKIYQPNLELTKKHHQWFKTFKAIYPSLKDLNARLHSLPT